MTDKIIDLKAVKWAGTHRALATIGFTPDGELYEPYEDGGMLLTNKQSIVMRDRAANDNLDPDAVYFNGDKVRKIEIREV
jgi:hypothetical protein